MGMVMAQVQHAQSIWWVSKVGALCFGLLVGWSVYFVNRYRKDVVIGDLSTVISAVGGAAILTLFPARTQLFAFYGIGLAVGFFAYFLLLLIFVWKSKGFGVEWFLDGRRPKLEADQIGSDQTRAMEAKGGLPVA